MPRTIDFDIDVAIDRATAVFWKHGYAGASLRELLKAMGIGEGSLYNTLKSKKQLYIRCLERFEATEGRRRVEALFGAPTAASGVRAMFGAVLDCLDDPDTPSRLCMQAAMATEEVLDDPDLRALVEADLAAFRGALMQRLSRDRADGLLPGALDPEIVAGVLVTYSQGLFRMALVDYERMRFEAQINAFLTGLGLTD